MMCVGAWVNVQEWLDAVTSPPARSPSPLKGERDSPSTSHLMRLSPGVVRPFKVAEVHASPPPLPASPLYCCHQAGDGSLVRARH